VAVYWRIDASETLAFFHGMGPERLSDGFNSGQDEVRQSEKEKNAKDAAHRLPAALKCAQLALEFGQLDV
jgi:hypothetical protein